MLNDREGYVPGPLDEIAPGLRRTSERWPALPIHPRIVHARAGAAGRSIVMASFARAASARALHAALKPLIEAALLSELSRPAYELEDDCALAAVELYAFAQPPFDSRPAFAPFALGPASLDEPDALHALALLRREARQVEGAGDEAIARYRAPLVRSPHPLARALAHALRDRAPQAAWGSAPGALAGACAELAHALGQPGIEPTRTGIERLEEVVVHRTAGVIRWIEPLLFQALCDLVAVAAATTFGLSVEWGLCEPDDDTKLAPPPLIRVGLRGESFHVPLGEHVLRWCVMPSAQGEEIPSLGAWTEHEFT